MMSNNRDLLNQFEIGGNFFELIEFSLVRRISSDKVYKGTYGVNVAKVREVVHMPSINPLASSVSGVAGVFELRGIPIPAVNLCQILGDVEAPITKEQQIIVTEFSQKRAGFIVNSTHRIRRVSWDKVLPPSSDSSSCMTGMILMDDREFLFILDLEKILANIESRGSGQVSNIYRGVPNQEQGSLGASLKGDPLAPGVLVVDDSRLILNNLERVLTNKGYRVLTADNGQKALERVLEIHSGRNRNFGRVHAIITDVEMPQMDGITFVKKVREIRELQELPILLHSSLDGDATKEAARKVGANGYVVKNDITNIMQSLEDLISKAPMVLGA
ncbi:chemotaxis protein [Pseudobacteriovorax antillogorgiicola]|uniref:Two-component system, chemotaxis family, response regulator CheV n=1 Tax=Pseudobacteriovorax antillogorgiicola TaxID=1513793 RepID=A0A1Y6C5A4_9BACT|nr:chemotaxis protein [Pseudobacteriovorax antillogorgiicola]TCS49457.1 two-component system chemotaxis response regulator CheV [Pseudobacteriovorax antillogorgiicola]SMF46390.1 two-component system, chemotaxis family, response regulator CheV [Pseudobacteriovorax antillogorgiicola]